MKTLITNRDIYEEIQVMGKKSEKQRHQVKSRWYYIFWGTCTVAVCAGQLFVGSGFRRMSNSVDKLLDTPIIIEMGPKSPFDYEFNHPMIIK